MSNKTKDAATGVDIAIRNLLSATKNDKDAISCLVLGDVRDGWAGSKGTVFVVRDAEIAEKLFKLLLSKSWSSTEPALTEVQL